MTFNRARTGAVVLLSLLVGAAGLVLRADAPLTPAAADQCLRKALEVNRRGVAPPAPAPRRTLFTEHEMNSYLALRAGSDLPSGLSKPTVDIIGQGRVSGTAIVDLDTIRKRRPAGGMMDPMNLLGGQVPVTITGILHTQNGMAKFELQDAEVSGFPVPKLLVQELVAYYTKTPDHPSGYDLDEAFALPYKIRTIEVGVDQAVVVQ